MPALLINIRIEDEEKFNLFKVTLADLQGLFSEYHIKFRGSYSRNCLAFVNELLDKNESLSLYQDLQQDDWVDATLNMMGNVKSRSVFLYFEDHKLVSSRAHLANVLNEFDKQQLDYLCYSWFQSSALGIENLLPLNPERGTTLHAIEYSKTQNALVGKISPGYYHFSLVSICSVDYFKSILNSCNIRFKCYNKIIAALLCRIFPYPTHRKVANILNYYASKCGIYYCLYPPASPFNLEKMWFETIFINRPLRFGFLTNELYANYDDDNGAYRETLIKRGLYPFVNRADAAYDLKQLSKVYIHINLKDGDLYDCTYFSHRGRIRKPPLVHIAVDSGKVIVAYQSFETTLEDGASELFFSNKKPVVRSIGESNITIGIFDECF